MSVFGKSEKNVYNILVCFGVKETTEEKFRDRNPTMEESP